MSKSKLWREENFLSAFYTHIVWEIAASFLSLFHWHAPHRGKFFLGVAAAVAGEGGVGTAKGDTRALKWPKMQIPMNKMHTFNVRVEPACDVGGVRIKRFFLNKLRLHMVRSKYWNETEEIWCRSVLTLLVMLPPCARSSPIDAAACALCVYGGILCLKIRALRMIYHILSYSPSLLQMYAKKVGLTNSEGRFLCILKIQTKERWFAIKFQRSFSNLLFMYAKRLIN